MTDPTSKDELRRLRASLKAYRDVADGDAPVNVLSALLERQSASGTGTRATWRWAAAAAACVLLFAGGVGVGRWTAASPEAVEPAPSAVTATPVPPELALVTTPASDATAFGVRGVEPGWEAWGEAER